MLTQGKIDQFYADVESLGLKRKVTEIQRATEFPKSNISEWLSRKKVPSENFIDTFYEKFEKELTKSSTNVPYESPLTLGRVNEDPAIYNIALPMGDLKLTVKDHIDFLKDTIKKAEEREQKLLMLLEKDISTIKTNSETIQADLQVLTGIVRSDDEVILKGTDRILGREEGASSTEAYIGERAFLDSDKEGHTSDSTDKEGSEGKERRQGKA